MVRFPSRCGSVGDDFQKVDSYRKVKPWHFLFYEKEALLDTITPVLISSPGYRDKLKSSLKLYIPLSTPVLQHNHVCNDMRTIALDLAVWG